MGEDEEEEDEDEEEEAGPLLAGLELLPREQVARLKEEVKSQMEQEFDSIISEVRTPGWAGTPTGALGPPWLGSVVTPGGPPQGWDPLARLGLHWGLQLGWLSPSSTGDPLVAVGHPDHTREPLTILSTP